MTATFRSLPILVSLALAGCASGGASSSDAAGAVEAAAPAEPADAPMSDAAPMLSKAQADRGRFTFRASCSGCHSSSEFSDGQFKRLWSRRTAGEFYDHIQETMPEDAPGSLTPAKYVEIVSYILRLNGFDAGEVDELDAERLSSISLASISGS